MAARAGFTFADATRDWLADSRKLANEIMYHRTRQCKNHNTTAQVETDGAGGW